MARVLVLSSEPVGDVMAGPAIRSSELARVLRDAGHDVRLEGPLERRAARDLAASHDVVVVQGWALERSPGVAEAAAHLVVDLYDPFSLELLMLLAGRPPAERERAQANALRALADQVTAGDFFLCASERQRDYWLGWLEALGRVSPRTHDGDPALRALIDVVPFGVPAQPPVARRPGPRRELGLEEEDVLLLWGGGVYDWFDPLTVVQAVQRVPRAHLVFMSARHPNPGLPASRVLAEARRAAGERVRFHESWVPYEDRATWLLDADVGVSAHLEHVEARFAFRTRILDYLWAGLPVLCTEGDALAEEIAAGGIGLALAPGDVDGWTAAIERMADPALRSECGRRASERARGLSWERVAEPLLRWCDDPRPAADRAAGGRLRPTREPPWSRRRVGALARRVRRRG